METEEMYRFWYDNWSKEFADYVDGNCVDLQPFIPDENCARVCAECSNYESCAYRLKELFDFLKNLP